MAQLRSEIGGLATTLAGRIVGESLEDDERARRTVDRFIADLESAERAERRGHDMSVASDTRLQRARRRARRSRAEQSRDRGDRRP